MDDVLKLLENMLPIDGDISISMKDELELTVKFYQDKLPSLFDQLYRDLRDAFSRKSTFETGELIERLIHILKVQSTLSLKVQIQLSDELLPTFELDPDDKKRVVQLCAQMRKIVFASEVFDQPHRRRLLNRIAAIEKQIEQPNGILDVIRGGVSDIGETLGKFGGDIKPLTDRMAEVMQITRAGSKEYEQLPAPDEVKQLPKPSDEEMAEDK